MRKLLLSIMCITIAVMVNAQNFNQSISLNLQVEADTTLLNVFTGNTVTSIGVSGHITYTSELGFVRFVISDNYDDEYMIYESYRLFENDSSFNFSQKCEESCFFDSYIPTKLIVQIKDAIVTIASVELSNTQYPNAEYQRNMAAKMADNTKLSSVQNYINANGLIWMAEHTKLSDLSYSSKAKLWGEDYKSYGFEYYAGGIYSLFGPNNNENWGSIDYTGSYVDNFDWRNRHGANDPNSAYYDQDIDGSGWLSPLTCQLGCWENGVFSCGPENECDGEYRSVGTCWDFGPTAQVEALANLYYNEHLDLDLSEQYIACEEGKMEPWRPDSAFCHFKNEGVPFEDCWPYTASLDNCSTNCEEPIDRVSIPSYSSLQNNASVETIRHNLIQNGPMAAHFIPSQTWTSHCMLLVGWGTIDESSPLVTGLPQGSIPDSWYGATYWIYKNSYGITADFNMFGGYSYLIHDHVGGQIGHIPKCYLVSLPIQVPGKTTSDINCIDNDGDGYYNWGIGPKPNHCPTCPDEPDGDDSNPSLGPLNEYGQCTIINSYNASFETGWDNWVQDCFQNGPENVDYDWWRHSGPTNHGNTGPHSAQNGSYYIYANGSFPSLTDDKVSISSPPIDLRHSDACKSMVDFYYHMKSSNYGNPEHNRLVLGYKRHNTGSNSWQYKEVAINNQGDNWKHATYLLPIDIEQIKFFAVKGEGACDVALDNVTIGPWNHNETPIVITDALLWDENMIINQDIIVENGGCLTIKKNSGANLNVNLHPDSRIIVKPGGRLILDHCTLTSSCPNELWQGIEVWGNNSTHQFEVNGSYGQGYLEIKNGAIIEKAKCAVELWQPGHWNSTGGIIHASDAIFKNNTMAVHALCYRNFNPGNNNIEAAYDGHFNNCSFIINGNYNGTETFEKHVVLANVNGLVFQGCDFSADRSVSGVHQWCIGISAYDAGFLVNSSCSSSISPCPEEDIDRSTFTGFCSGIMASSNGNHPRSFSVRKAIFTNNDRGIQAENLDFPIILNSEFNIGRGEYCDYNYGIYFNNVTSFIIEENYFHPSSQSNATTVGIAITDSRGVNDVYHNTFENLSRANLALGQNIVGTNSASQGTVQGLTYTCNDNTGNQRDFMVLLKDGAAAIQPQQGSSAIPAGNTFRNSGFQFYNEGSQQIEYYYNSNEIDETPNTSLLYRVNPHGTTNSNPCYSHYGNGPMVKSASEKTALESDYLSAYTAYLNLKQLYENSIDGGSTATQVADINNATSADMWQLRAQLLGLSPYVSGEVLTTAADRHDVFTDPVLFEILAANPDELKNDSLIAYLESKTNPLPNYMIELLRQIASGATSRTALVAQMGKYSHDYALAAGDIIRSNLNDTIANQAELRYWLGNMNDISADRMAISSYLHEGDSTSAFALANMLPELYGLQGDALVDHTDYLRLLSLYQALKSTHRNVYELTEAEITTVRDIAESGTGVSKSMAASLMAEITDEDRGGCFAPEMPDLEEGGTGRGINMDSSLNKALGFSVNVTPNPAITWVTIDYTLPMKTAKATLTMTNTIGTNVLSTELEGIQGSKILDLRGLTAGVYLYTIRCGQYVENGKIVIAK